MKQKKELHMNDVFSASLKWIINILILYIILVLLMGLGKTLFSIKDLFYGDQFAQGFSHVITDILTFLVILELFRSFIEYFKAKRFRLHSMMDPFIIFVAREFIVILYSHKHVNWQNLIGFAAVILSLGIVRTMAVVYSPKDLEE
ncbi:MAG: phosphate-starvation-inducible PsiE family protein [Desulfobacterales bacterium]|nr:phosphate-starvation-inducible PsiE family protein [Desulfobacterales bacterium]